jgi:hypothetical protein
MSRILRKIGEEEKRIRYCMYLLENNLLALPPNSCDGEPAPDRVLLAILPAEFKPPDRPKGDRKALPLDGSVGELLAVEEPERGRPVAGVGRYPKVRCSFLADDIIDYSSTKVSRIWHERW